MINLKPGQTDSISGTPAGQPTKKLDCPTKTKTVEMFGLTMFDFPLQFATAVLAGNDTFLTESITEDRKKFITQSKHMIF